MRFSFISRSGVRGLLSGSDSAAASMAASLRRGSGPGSGSTFSRPSGSTRTSFLSVFLRRTIIVSFFILRRLACRSATDPLLPFSKHNNHNATRNSTGQKKTVLAVLFTLVQLDEGERVLKSKNRILKAYTVFFVVGSGLGEIPFEVICHKSNGSQ